MDGNPSSFCRSTQAADQWVSVQVMTMNVAAGVGVVAIYNAGSDLSLLSPFEVWVGSAASMAMS